MDALVGIMEFKCPRSTSSCADEVYEEKNNFDIIDSR
jgi:hypothetical protein